jgi:hypothetical protein
MTERRPDPLFDALGPLLRAGLDRARNVVETKLTELLASVPADVGARPPLLRNDEPDELDVATRDGFTLTTRGVLVRRDDGLYDHVTRWRVHHVEEGVIAQGFASDGRSAELAGRRQLLLFTTGSDEPTHEHDSAGDDRETYAQVFDRIYQAEVARGSPERLARARAHVAANSSQRERPASVWMRCPRCKADRPEMNTSWCDNPFHRGRP